MVHQVNSVRKVFGVLVAKIIQFGVRTTSAIMRTRAQFENVYCGILFIKDIREQFCLIMSTVDHKGIYISSKQFYTRRAVSTKTISFQHVHLFLYFWGSKCIFLLHLYIHII